jgi:hypothetical protein
MTSANTTTKAARMAKKIPAPLRFLAAAPPPRDDGGDVLLYTKARV